MNVNENQQSNYDYLINNLCCSKIDVYMINNISVKNYFQ